MANDDKSLGGPGDPELGSRRAHVTLFFNTLGFAVCFAAWMLNGVLVTFLVDNRIYGWTTGEMGVLIGTPVLTGALMRLPVGIATDRFGGRPVFTGLLLASAVPMALLSVADGFWPFFACSLGFGLAGSAFAAGIAFTSVWYPKKNQGMALGIFGAGNAGAAVTTLGAPSLLRVFTDGGANAEGWRRLPLVYAAALVLMAIVFVMGTTNRKAEGAKGKTFGQLLAPLRHVRVWRFGLYYFLVFGGFVALAQWLVPYYVNVYSMTVLTAGLLTSIFSLPSGVIRVLGGWMSDKYGARSVMYWMLGIIAVCCALLFFPKMDIESPGSGVAAVAAGRVTDVSATRVRVGDRDYALRGQPASPVRAGADTRTLLLPVVQSWHEPTVAVGDRVAKKQLVARGVTHIYFQANVWIFTLLVFIVGMAMGIGKAAVYRYIPDYFPNEVGVVGGIVGVIGGLGGFVCPIVFGFLLDWIGLWTSTWIFLFAVTVACLVWLTLTVKRTLQAPV